jgi:hypothetical protein
MVLESDSNEPKQDPFMGFGFAIRSFYVNATQLRVARSWRRSTLQSDEPQFNITISAKAKADKDDVCVIGSDERSEEFYLTIRSDVGLTEQWRDIVRMESVHIGKIDDTPQSRVRHLQHSRFEKEPPTATLFVSYPDEEIGNSGGWIMECNLAQDILEKIVADVERSSTNDLQIKIRWECGLVRDKHAPPAYPTSWGMFRLTEGEPPEPLRGYVESVNWALTSDDKVAVTSISSSESGDVRSYNNIGFEWIKIFEERCLEDSATWMKRAKSAVPMMATHIEEWCRLNGKSDPKEARWRIEESLRFMQRVDETLHPAGGPFVAENYDIWRHRNLAHIYANTTPQQRIDCIDGLASLPEIISEYLATPWMQNTFYDWVFVDALLFGQTIVELESLLKIKHGAAYTLFSGIGWKMTLWKVFARSVGFAIGWVLPAFIFYWLSDWSTELAIGLSVLYYGLLVVSVFRWLWISAANLFAGRQSELRRIFQVVENAERAYALLRGPTLHVAIIRSGIERAAENGVQWNHQVFYLLDRVASHPDLVWVNSPRW